MHACWRTFFPDGDEAVSPLTAGDDAMVFLPSVAAVASSCVDDEELLSDVSSLCKVVESATVAVSTVREFVTFGFIIC